MSGVATGGRHPPEPPRPAGRHRNWVSAVLWVVIGGLAIVVAMRIVAWDELEPFALLNNFTPFLYLPAWIVVVVAVLERRFALAAVAVLIVAAQIALMLPELTATQPLPRWAAAAPSIRLLDANVFSGNPSMAGYASEIKAFAPQLVTMEEATPFDAAQLERSGALAGLPYQFDVHRFDPKAFFLASKYPLTDEHVLYFDYIPLLVQTVIDLPSGPQDLWVVHTTAPLPGAFAQWKGQLAYVEQLLAARKSSRLLIVGDFNATWGSKGFRTILGSGMTDGAAARGHAFEMTWTQALDPLPPLVRIDHVLTGPGLAVTKIRTDAGIGSDHRDLIATVAIQPSAKGTRHTGA
jgi:endonuclease/exonuclease/phosphatase (EEP) superfamily protein YafD